MVTFNWQFIATLSASVCGFLVLLLTLSSNSEYDESQVCSESQLQVLERLSQRLNTALKELGQLQCTKKSNVTETGGWCDWPLSHKHYTDQGLADGLSSLFPGKTVASFGEGPGFYKNILSESVETYDAFDGSPFIEDATNNSVKFLDLTVPLYGFQKYDWILCLEVAEHIPPFFEEIFLNNLFRHASEGIVLSWAVPNQDGYEHVNPKTHEWVKNRFASSCFQLNLSATRQLRRRSSLPWFRNNLLVFDRAKCHVFKSTE